MPLAPRVIPLLLLACVASLAWAQGADPDAQARRFDPRLPFEVEAVPGGVPILVLGVNRFTPQQLATFVTGVDAFVVRAQGRALGQQVVWRVDGLRGYLAVSTSPFSDGPPFLLTARGEPVRSFSGEAALRNAMVLLGRSVLSLVSGRPDGFDGGGPFQQRLFP